MHPGQGQRSACIDATDAGVSVGAAEDLTVQHTRQVDVRSVPCATHDLVRTVVADGARADHAVGFLGIGEDDVGFVVKHRATTSRATLIE